MNSSRPEAAAILGAAEHIRSTQPFIFRRRVLWGECDPAGIVYTPRFTDYVTIAAFHFLGYLLGGSAIEGMRRHQFGTPCKALNVVFHSPLRPDQIFDMTVSTSRIGTTTFELAVAGTTENGVAAFDANITLITVRHTEIVAIPVPKVLREGLARHIREPASASEQRP